MIKEKKIFVFGILLFAISFLVLPWFASSQETSFCCEKTKAGAWCQNSPETDCDTAFRKVPTSCEGTSYCKQGTCVNPEEGTCVENTPKVRCEEQDGIKKGTWYDKSPSEVPLCQAGCCLIGDQAAFVTQTRCQKLSSFYGLNINFRTDITNELDCLASAGAEEKGACVFETQTGKTCRFLTKAECQAMKAENPSAIFYENFLCSNPNLGADCGMTKKTTCVETKDQVYFTDSCGNLANVYDYSKIDDVLYWSYIQENNLCALDLTDDNSVKECGNCDYLSGSTCRDYTFGIDSWKPKAGDYVCRDLNCKSGSLADEFKKEYGRFPSHGERWCGRISSEGISLGESEGLTGESLSDNAFSKGTNYPGARDLRFMCYNGEITTEPCADFRQEICVQEEITSDFLTSSCKANRWRDCYEQTNKKECENTAKRECVFIKGASIIKNTTSGKDFVLNENGQLVESTGEADTREGASCVPKYAPGFDFWKENTEARGICSLGKIVCVAYIEQGIGGAGKKVVSTEENILGFSKDTKIVCFDENGNLVEDWKNTRMNLCSAIGDCGISANYIDEKGFYQEGDVLKIA